jgi:hypothetical protein
MNTPQIADAQAKSSLRRLRRKRRKLARIYRLCETTTVIVLWVAFLLQLGLKDSNAMPKEIMSGKLVLADQISTPITQQVAHVPEPRAALLVGIGLAAICFWRRKNQIAISPATAPEFQASSTATAAA